MLPVGLPSWYCSVLLRGTFYQRFFILVKHHKLFILIYYFFSKIIRKCLLSENACTYFIFFCNFNNHEHQLKCYNTGLSLEVSVLEGAICGLGNGRSCTPSCILFYSYPFYLFVISLPPLSLPAAYYLFFLLSASRIIMGTQVWRLQREIQRSTYPMLFLVILSYNILFLSFVTASYFYSVLFFQLVYCLSLFTSRLHWRHLLLNAQQLRVSGIKHVLMQVLWMRGTGAGIWLDK